MRPRIIFITGTDTGVGKTVLTGLLLSHLRQNGFAALSLKPFCSGSRADAKLLHDLQDGELTLDEMNPFHFSEPLAPLIAARLHHRRIPFENAVAHVRAVLGKLSAKGSKPRIRPVLLIEGAGGLLAPLGESRLSSRFTFRVSGRKGRGSFYTALDIIKALNCEVIIVAPNRLGTINHTLLTIHALQVAGVQSVTVVLNTQYVIRNTGHAVRTNPSILSELLVPIPLFRLHYLGKNPARSKPLKATARKLKKTLAQISA